MGFWTGDSPDFDWEQSPEMAWLWQNVAQPLWQQLMGGGPTVTPVPMPTEGWFEGLDPSIKSGIREPYEYASKQLMEQMGAKGQTGSAMSPYSGSAQTAAGRFWSDAATGMGQQAWGMINPNAMAQWGMQQQANFLPYQMLPGVTQQSLPYPVVTPGSPGMLQGLSQLLSPLAAGWAYGGFQNPFA